MMEGMEYDRVSFTWVTPEEMARRRAEREERAFRRKPKQGELCAPMIISDSQGGIRGVQSMQDGKFYDSKSVMRQHYRDAGVIEVGNEQPKKETPRASDPEQKKKRQAAIGKALSYAGFGAP